jgi:hypothetical protein
LEDRLAGLAVDKNTCQLAVRPFQIVTLRVG